MFQKCMEFPEQLSVFQNYALHHYLGPLLFGCPIFGDYFHLVTDSYSNTVE
jgi:hypothetical protein